MRVKKNSSHMPLSDNHTHHLKKMSMRFTRPSTNFWACHVNYPTISRLWPI